MLIDNGALLMEKGNCGDTPIHVAALQGHRDIICLLRSSGADCSVKGEEA